MNETYYSEEIISGIKIIVITSRKGIKKLFLNPKEEIQELSTSTKLHNDDPYLFSVFKQLREYFSGERKTFNVPLDLDGTDFQKKVWEELQKIPFGKTISYKTLAENFGDVKAIRAVGKANGQNPVAIIVPCHRVIGTDGSLIGYACGLDIKEKLLQLEGVLDPNLFD
jgi:methylated-DNA-[protein]-cysteine S-methyltransferase